MGLASHASKNVLLHEGVAMPILNKPHRVRLSRVKGARLPQNSMSVARPTRWGNPNLVEHHGEAGAVRAYERDLLGGVLDISVADVEKCLRGRSLACWCQLDRPCHADVLLRLANTTPARRVRST